MIVRSVNVFDLSKFDFFNDAEDTIRFLKRTGRHAEAYNLQQSYDAWGACRNGQVRLVGDLKSVEVGPIGTADFAGTQYHKIQLNFVDQTGRDVVVDCQDVSPQALVKLRDRINELLQTYGSW